MYIKTVVWKISGTCSTQLAGRVPQRPDRAAVPATVLLYRTGRLPVTNLRVLVLQQQRVRPDPGHNLEAGGRVQQQQRRKRTGRNLSAAINIVQPEPQQQPDTTQRVVNFFEATDHLCTVPDTLPDTDVEPVHTLDQIEKQHPATTPQKDCSIVTGKITAEVSNLENSFKLMGTLINTEPAHYGVVVQNMRLFTVGVSLYNSQVVNKMLVTGEMSLYNLRVLFTGEMSLYNLRVVNKWLFTAEMSLYNLRVVNKRLFTGEMSLYNLRVVNKWLFTGEMSLYNLRVVNKRLFTGEMSLYNLRVVNK
ncbi:conserved hypothetical protein [Culex quinquefasciatus]|uniref:Uncharacterized protein n=1 Tax=Culex quinquefasciatus TaxID=7176 RepID=B0XBL7_CULQU|nr:conserved hypothetical protein [Culex quinquefasciatus]|eukprot:XP_001867039.1 conserved hypothetical protein [Culex quinquefasciatus]